MRCGRRRPGKFQWIKGTGADRRTDVTAEEPLEEQILDSLSGSLDKGKAGSENV